MSCWHRFTVSVTDSWYKPDGGWTTALKPLSWLFAWLAGRRKQRYLRRKRWSPPVPVVVVGNITVGGTGKTPLVTALVTALQDRGYRPGIISRGFGAKSGGEPVWVTPGSDPVRVGDEPVMLARQLNVPLVVAADRVRAARYLLSHCDCDLIIADDGLQHYNLQRHIELLVLDGDRLLGNRLCLPAGPLREPLARMGQVDLILINTSSATPTLPKLGDVGAPCPEHFCFSLKPSDLVSVSGTMQPAPGVGRVHGVAGIGHPERFFNTLRSLGYDVISHPFPDHHPFTPADITFDDNLPVLMTAKDAVKCTAFATDRHWYLPVTAEVPTPCLEQLVTMIDARTPAVSG